MMKKILKVLVLVILALLPCLYAASADDDAAKEATYQRAIEFVDAGEYDIALSIFEMLGDYKDSAAQILICQNAKSELYYDNAIELFNNGEYDAAKEIFLMLGSYKDSVVQAIRCDTQKKQDQYDIADTLAKNGEFEKARESFRMLGDFSDSPARVTQMDDAIAQVQYNAALELENAEKYEEAISAYQALGEFKDAAERISICTQQITIRDISSRLSAALNRSPFDPKEMFALLGEAQNLKIDTQDWFEKAYDLETSQRYGEAIFLDEDIDGDGKAERIVSDNDGLIVLSREASGLAEVSAVYSSPYSLMHVESDPAGRKYLIANNGETVDVYLLDMVPELICNESDPEGEAEITLSASGFTISYIISDMPKRQAQTEYLVLSKDQFSAINYPVVVDMNNYPRVDTAFKLLSLYQEANLYNSKEELKKLESPEADSESIEIIRSWLIQNPKIERAELAVWNEDTQDFTCVVDSSSDRMIVHIEMNDNGELTIRGL